ncbi:MAG: hypothetical protein IPK85_02110 [Gemmatimonadetes bacterium]|nr:hypothetical protein [Gemmatimonadota bacterium]
MADDPWASVAVPKSEPDEWEKVARVRDTEGVPEPSNAAATATSWLGRQALGAYDAVSNAITGNDRREFNYEEFPRLQVPGWGETSARMSLGRTDDRKLDILRQGLKEKITNAGTDKFGNAWVEYEGKRYYLNSPGVSGQDVDDTFTQMMITMPFAGLAGKAGGAALGLLGRAVGTGAGVAAGSLATDKLAQESGATAGMDLGDAVTAGALGAAGELAVPLVGKAYRAIFGSPALFDAKTGRLTEAGIREVQKLGIDPADISKEWAARFGREAKSAVDPTHAARYTDAQTLPVPVPLTRGDVSGQPGQQMTESMMRKGAYGQGAAATMIGAREQADDALRANLKAIPQRMAGDVGPVVTAPGQGAAAVQSALSNARDVAKKNVDDLYATARGTAAAIPGRDALRLSHEVRGALGDFMIDPALTPKTAKMLESLDAISGAQPGNREVLLTSLERWRRQASNLAKGMPDADSTALRRAIQEVDSGLQRLLDADLVSGDPAAIKAWRDARRAHSSYATLFKDVKDATGQKNIIARLVQKDAAGNPVVSPLEAANLIFGSSSLGANKFGMVRDLRNLRAALPDEQWNQIRQEAFLRLARSADGGVASEGQRVFSGANFAGAVNDAFRDNAEVMRMLFTPEERSLIRQLARVGARSTIRVPGGDNTSNTAVAQANFVQKLISMLPLASPQSKAAVAGIFAPATRLVQGVRAAGMVDATPSRLLPPPGVLGTATGVTLDEQAGRF